MRVFVAGATGAIGRPLVRQLVEQGHDVTGMTRTPAKQVQLEEAGASAVVADAFDAPAVVAAIRSAQPEVVIHQLTALPDSYDLRKYEKTMAATNRLREEATGTLLRGAREAGARRFIAQSIAFAYDFQGDWVKSEDEPLIQEGPKPLLDAFRVIEEMEKAVLSEPAMEGIVLRYGMFYGPGTYWSKDGFMGREIRKRRLPIVGPGDARFSMIHVEDAAAATVAARDRGVPGIYNVADDDPAPAREFLPAFAAAIGAKRPFRVPKALATIFGGRIAGLVATEVRGASNEKVKRELGWRPRYASWRQGFVEASS